jgi:hypothetical protein
METYFVMSRNNIPKPLLSVIVIRDRNPLTTRASTAIVTVSGGPAVRRGVWTLVLFLLSAVVCVSAIPLPDLPETSYNEVDTPVNQAPPVVPGVRYVRPAIAPLILPRRVWEAGRGVSSQAIEPKSADTLVRRDPQSLQDLLCTFLI